MGKINEELAALYASRLEGLQKMYAELEEKGITDWVRPLLMHCWEEEYVASKKRLMVIGKETRGWGFLAENTDVKSSIEHYKWFELGNKDPKSLFWMTAKPLNKRINGTGHDKSFLWTNINKFGIDGSGRPDPRVTDLENTHFNVFSRELEITKPDVCIFLTGPSYDGDIQAKLGTVEREAFVEGESSRGVCRLKNKHLPPASYRTYHPRFGSFHKERYQKILDAIVEDALKQ